MEAASLWMDQGIRRDGDELALLRIRLACLAKSGRPARLPEGLKAALKQFVPEAAEEKERV